MSQDRPQPEEQPAAPRCRTCDAPLEPDSPHAPFCSARCRMADLGRWFSGQYKISRELKEQDLDELD